MMVTWENYEEYLIMHADGELQPPEESALMEFIKANPQLQGELDMYKNAHLTPETSLTYANKDGLMKPVPAKRIVLLPLLKWASMAAGIAAVLIVTINLIRNNNDTGLTNTVAHAVENNSPSIKNPTNDTTGATSTHLGQKNNIGSAIPDAGTAVNGNPLVVKKQQNVATSPLAKNGFRPAKDTLSNREEFAAAIKQLRIEPLPTPALKMFETLNDAPAPLYTNNNSDEHVIARINDGENWVGKLPIDGSKKEKLTSFGNAIASGMDKIAETKEKITSTKLSIRVEKRKLILSF